MNREAALARLKAVEPALRVRGVSHAALFGSLARGEATAASDIDVLVEIAPEARLDVFAYVDIVQLIEDQFPVKVDVSNSAALKPLVRVEAEGDAVYAF